MRLKEYLLYDAKMRQKREETHNEIQKEMWKMSMDIVKNLECFETQRKLKSIQSAIDAADIICDEQK